MRKIKIFALSLLFVCCDENKYKIPFDNETIRTTITQEGYVIVEKYNGSNGFGHTFWKLVSINKNDSITQKNRE